MIRNPLLNILLTFFQTYFYFLVLLCFSLQSVHAENTNYKIETLVGDAKITQNVVSGFCQDSLGFVWFGKSDGLYKYNGYEIEYFSTSYDDRVGLSNPSVNDVQDCKQYLIVATNNGLNFFNKETQAITYLYPSDYDQDYNNKISCLNINSNHEIILGTVGGLLRVIFEPDLTFTIQRINMDEVGSNNTEVFQLISLSNGTLARTSKGLYFVGLDDDKARRIHVKSQDTNLLSNINAICLTRANELLIASGEKVFFTNLEQKGIDSDKEYFVQSLKYLFPNWPEIKRINVFLEDSRGNVWIGSDGEGVFIYNKNARSWHNYSHKMNQSNVLKNDFVRELFEDRSGMILVGSDAGVNVLVLEQNNFDLINKFECQNREEEIVNVHAILKDNDEKLWIGTRGKGLFVLNKKENVQINIKKAGQVSLDHIRTIIQDRNGQVWLGTDKGIFIEKDDHDNLVNIYKTRKADLLANKYVYSIVEDCSSNIWISTGEGLYVYTASKKLKDVTRLISGPNLENKIIYTIMIDELERIWICTLNGSVGFISPDEYKQKIQSPNNSSLELKFESIQVVEKYRKLYENFECYSILDFGNNEIFVGTNFGLCEINTEKMEMTPFFVSHPDFNLKSIRSYYVFGMLKDKVRNMLWTSTNGGLVSFNFDKKEVNQFTVKDGLQSMEFNGNAVFRSSEGNLFFGGANGVNVYDASRELKKSNYKPNIVITSLSVNGVRVVEDSISSVLTTSISYADNIELEAEKNTIGLEFASLHLPYSINNSYKCRLIGVDTDWISLGQKRSINYANLPKGEYLFQVLGTNNDGVWNTDVRSFGITILPAWFELWWVKLIWYVSGFLVVGSFVFIVLKNRDNASALKIKELENDKIEEIYESKLVFFTNISHEFRTPLSLIVDPINSLIRQKKLYATNKDLFDIIRSNTDRLCRLTDQVLDFRKYEKGKLNLKISEGDIVETLKGISSSFMYYADLKGVDFSVQFPDKPVLMYFDIDKLEKIVYNLLSNAFKVSLRDGVVNLVIDEIHKTNSTLSLDSYHFICGDKDCQKYDNHVFIKITDDAIGISEENFHSIFNRFFQGDGVEAGTGIGLYMVKQLVEMHHGSIFLKSEMSRGTSFVVILPKNDDLYKPVKRIFKPHVNIVEKNENINPLTNSELIVTNTQKNTVVVVEDNDELRAYLKQVLSLHFNVFSASNGVEGIDLIEEEVPDVVVSDIVMPELSGLELCKSIKGKFETSHIPIILLTARTFDNQIVEGIENGADAYITKPFNTDILIAKINNLIQKHEKLRLLFQNSKILEPSKISVTSIDEQLLHKLKDTVEEAIQDPDLTLEVLAAKVGVSRAQLFRKIKALTGLTPNNFIKSIRLKYAAQLLEDDKFQMSEIAFLSGFKEPSYFSRCFKEANGCSPKEYKKTH